MPYRSVDSRGPQEDSKVHALICCSGWTPKATKLGLTLDNFNLAVLQLLSTLEGTILLNITWTQNAKVRQKILIN